MHIAISYWGDYCLRVQLLVWSSSLEVVADPSSPSAQPERKQPARPPSPQHETTELTTNKIMYG